MEPNSSSQAGSSPNFIEIWILALSQPKEATYKAFADDPDLTVGRAALWIAVTSLVGYGVAFSLQVGQLTSVMQKASQQTDLGEFAGFGALILLCLLPVVAGMAVLGQAIYVAIVQFVAGALGGQGTFGGLFGATAAYAAPVALVTTLLSVIPLVGACLSLPISLYAMYLGVLAIKSVNQFGWGRAIGSLFVPLIVFLLVTLIIFFGLLFPVMQDMIQEMTLVWRSLI